MKQSSGYSLMFGTVSALTAILLVGALFWRQRKRPQIQEYPLEKMELPKKWTKVGDVSELILYPLKGGKRKCVPEAEFTKTGLREVDSNQKLMALKDRVFVVFNEQNEFINGKKNSKIMLVETKAINESTVKFSFPELEDLVVKIPDGKSSSLHQIKFYFGEKVHTMDCGEEAAVWFSQLFLGESSGLRLGCFVPSVIPARSTEGAFEDVSKAYTKLHSEYLGAYSDMASYMVINEESIKDLNSRIEQPITEHHFRPNLMVKGPPAYSEDSWDWIKIGDNVVLRSFKFCTRCVITTINPDTLKKDPSVEPLRTLRKYRQVKDPKIREVEHDSPIMGMYLGCHQTGFVRIGDPVYINSE